MENEHNLKTLPLELQFDILSRLPLKQLLGLKCLSRWWNVEISSLRLSKLYQQHRKGLDKSSLDGGSIILVNRAVTFCFDFHSNILRELPPPANIPNIHGAKIKGSANGLLLFVETNVETELYVLYNPVTGASALLPPLVIDLPDHLGPNIAMGEELHVGFGYDSRSEDYKILRLISYRKQDEEHVVAYLYSMKMNSWKKIKPDPSNQRLYFGPPSLGLVYCNNAFHWISKNFTDRDGDIVISALNASTGTYYMLPRPNEQVCLGSLVVLKECLHLVSVIYFNISGIWIMREYGVQHSWTKLLHYTKDEFIPICGISGPITPLPYAYSADEQELLMGIEIYPKTFVSHNLRTQEMRTVQVTNVRLQNYRRIISSYSVMPWMPSLAHPCSL